MRLRAALVGAVLGLGLGACGGGSGDAAPATTPTGATTARPSAQPCPGATAPSALEWPRSFPSDLPKPPGSSRATPVPASNVPGLSIVRFTTATSIREGILFAVERIPQAGFTLGRGDAEALEADAPFSRGDVRGLYRMAYAGPCSTQWLVAVARSGGSSPLLPQPTASSSPLPFGP